jgi:hypothetical protein
MPERGTTGSSQPRTNTRNKPRIWLRIAPKPAPEMRFATQSKRHHPRLAGTSPDLNVSKRALVQAVRCAS